MNVIDCITSQTVSEVKADVCAPDPRQDSDDPIGGGGGRRDEI